MCIVVAEKHLSTFFGSTKDLSPEERGKHLESDTVRSCKVHFDTESVVSLTRFCTCS